MNELIATGLTKRYGATRALSGLDIRLISGTVIGIAGPNGAGKSTLMRVLSGEERPDSGDLVLVRDGQATRDFKVAVVHQEPQVWPNLSVWKNLEVGREEEERASQNRGDAETEKILRLLSIDMFADFELVDLPLAVHQRVEIARAMLHKADVFLFDEPNSALTDEESKALFELMERLAQAGKIVILVTHRLNDLVSACSDVMILREGRIVAELRGDSALTEAAIAAQLTLTEHVATTTSAVGGTPKTPMKDQKVLLALKSCADAAGAFQNVDLDVRAGTVLVLAGVEGSGARELTQVIGQFRPANPGRTNGCATEYIAASRKHTVFSNMSVAENLAIRLGRDRMTTAAGTLSLAAINRLADNSVRRYTIKVGHHSNPVTSLSGGNQQKVVLGATLETNADIIVVEEPTRGVDISSKREIYALLKSYCRAGKAVVLFCTEVPEMYDVADEVVVLSRGSIAGRISMSEISNVSHLVEVIARFERKEAHAQIS
ncbi:MAG: sugar ABC transporter ATP-binding protein [Rhizobiales bacterium]|nr:sugar ABC transporter ATP-binding protein [Hyphomicrobiales bacterium]